MSSSWIRRNFSLLNFTHREHCLTAPQPPKRHPRSRGCVIPVNYCIEDDLGTQVSTNIRQPDLVFFKNVLTCLFSFLYSVAANTAMKDEVKPGQLMQLHLPLSALPPILHASPMLSCSGGNLQEKRSTDGQWRWEQVSQVHFTWVNPQLCQSKRSQHNQTQAGCEIPKFTGFSWDQTPGTWMGHPACRRRW